MLDGVSCMEYFKGIIFIIMLILSFKLLYLAPLVIGGQLATTHTMSNDQGQNTIAAQTSGLLVDPVTVCKW